MHISILPKFIPMFDLSGFSPGPALGFGKYTLKVPLKYYKKFCYSKSSGMDETQSCWLFSKWEKRIWLLQQSLSL